MTAVTDTNVTDTKPDEPVESSNEFERAADEPTMSLLAEFWLFIREEKKWWLTPIILVLLLASAAIFLTSTGAAPFIYTLF
jgi:hypothetical protein